MSGAPVLSARFFARRCRMDGEVNGAGRKGVHVRRRGLAIWRTGSARAGERDVDMVVPGARDVQMLVPGAKGVRPRAGRLTRRVAAVTVGALLAAGACRAAEQAGTDAVKVLDLAGSLRIAAENSAVLANARRDERIAASKVTQARAAALPNFAVNGTYTRLDEVEEISFEGESFEAGTLDNYSLSAEVTQLLYSGGQVSAALRAAHQTREWSEWERRDTEFSIRRQVREGFYDILLAREAVEVRREAVRQLEDVLKDVRGKFERGAASEFDLLRAQVSLANERPALIAARNEHELARESFRKLLGLGTDGFELEGELELVPLEIPLDELLSLAVLHRPVILAQGVLVELREEDVVAERAETRPSLSTFFSYNGAKPYGFVSYDDDWEWHWNAGLSLSWDVWDGGLTAGAVREKRLELEKSREDLEELRKAVALEVRQAYLDMLHARESVLSGEGNVELAEKALRIARARQESGLGTHLEFTDANVALRTATLSHLRALHAHSVALAKLEYACGLKEEELRKR